MTAPDETNGKIDLPVVLYTEDGRDGEKLWFALSVLTSDLPAGRTAAEAVDGLVNGLLAALRVARKRGATFAEWWQRQVPDEARWIQLYFRSAEASAVERRHVDAGPDGDIELLIATAAVDRALEDPRQVTQSA